MPILVKDFTWTQTSKCVHIRVPISDVHREKVDLFTTDSYIKAHFSPFLFEVFLLHDVDNSKSKCIIQKDMIMLDLEKKEEKEWEKLGKELTKKEKMELKEEIHRKCQEQAKQESEDRMIKKSQMDRYAVQQAMDLDTKLYNLMDARRDHERNKTMSQLDEWTKSINNPRDIKEAGDRNGVTITEITEIEDEADEIKDESKEEVNVQKDERVGNKPKDVDEENEMNKEWNQKNFVNEKKQKQITKFTRIVKTPVKSEYVEKKKEELKKRVLPRLREMGEVEITHTPRTFPTPSRESTADEEQTWLKNITQARRATGFVSEDLRPEEQDPQWCKEKGDEFFRSGNFLGAISAYSHGITLSDKLPSLYANRSATHFALGNFNKCMNDCSTALDLMRPACEANRRSRAKCIARRAAALARIGYLNKAIDEMKAAAKLLPDDETIKKDIYDMERAWEQNPDSD